MSPLFNASSALQRFKLGNTVKICNGLLFDTQDCHKTILLRITVNHRVWTFIKDMAYIMLSWHSWGLSLIMLVCLLATILKLLFLIISTSSRPSRKRWPPNNQTWTLSTRWPRSARLPTLTLTQKWQRKSPVCINAGRSFGCVHLSDTDSCWKLRRDSRTLLLLGASTLVHGRSVFLLGWTSRNWEWSTSFGGLMKTMMEC